MLALEITSRERKHGTAPPCCYNTSKSDNHYYRVEDYQVDEVEVVVLKEKMKQRKIIVKPFVDIKQIGVIMLYTQPAEGREGGLRFVLRCWGGERRLGEHVLSTRQVHSYLLTGDEIHRPVVIVAQPPTPSGDLIVGSYFGNRRWTLDGHGVRHVDGRIVVVSTLIVVRNGRGGCWGRGVNIELRMRR